MPVRHPALTDSTPVSRSGALFSERVKKAGAPMHQGMKAVRTTVWAAAILLAARQARRSTRQAVDAICMALTR